MSASRRRTLAIFIADEFNTELAGGDWNREPWFLKLDSMRFPLGGGFSKAELNTAARNLSKVYTPSRCRKMFSGDAHHARICYPLFETNWSGVAPLIDVGLALEGLDPIPGRILRGLCDSDQFAPTSLELEVMANLRRAGIDVEYEPLGRKGPDFRIWWDYREYFLECKLVIDSDGDVLSREIDDYLYRRVLFGISKGMSLRLCGPEREALRTNSGRQRLLRSTS